MVDFFAGSQKAGMGVAACGRKLEALDLFVVADYEAAVQVFGVYVFVDSKAEFGRENEETGTRLKTGWWMVHKALS